MWQMYRPLAYRDTWSVIPMLLRPKSRGRVMLRSKNPYDKPIFHAGYFTHPEDVQVSRHKTTIHITLVSRCWWRGSR